jgi:hypothetical protein
VESPDAAAAVAADLGPALQSGQVLGGTVQTATGEMVDMMSIVKRCGWILIGVVIGALATGSIGAVKQQTVDQSRLKTTFASTPIGLAAFVKDTKSDGCWLVFSKDAAVSVATAPPQACQASPD